MSWASIYWDLEHIIQEARHAMQSAYELDLAAQPSAPLSLNPTPANLPTEISVVLNLDGQQSGVASGTNADAVGTVEITFSTGVDSNQEIQVSPPEKQTDSLEVSLTKISLAAKPLSGETTNVQVRNLWTAEIEAALREFLRPLSVNLRYEYRIPDSLDERRSIDAMNSLFKQPAKPDDIEIRNVLARNELRRKRNPELRKTLPAPPHERRSSSTR